MPDLNKLYEKAEKYLQKQKFESAFETYLEIQKYQPADEKVLLTLGDLSLNLKRTADALRFQSLLVDQYIKRNDIPKAIATCRKILKISPQDAATLATMAGLLEKSQKTGEALEAYREALKLHNASGASRQSLECLQRIVKLDSANPQGHVELGELASRLRQPKIAAEAYVQAAQIERQAGRGDRWGELVERAHGLDPENEAASLGACELFLKKNRAAEAAAVLEPLARSKPDDLAILEPLAKAYLDTGQAAKAEPLCWKVYEARPERIDLLLQLAERLATSHLADRALSLTARLKERLFQQGKRNEFLKIVERVFDADQNNLEMLEKLAALYNELNDDDGLRRSLNRLFSLYLGSKQYNRAADALERTVDLEPYGQGHYDRLRSLEGHIDPALYKRILDRVEKPQGALRATAASITTEESTQAETAETLEDLLVEGEMFHQYQLAPKLRKTLEKIDRLYPGAQETNVRLRELYEAAGFTPTPASPSSAGAPAAGPAQSLQELKKISEMTANIYRESTSQAVVQIAVNEIGRALEVTRCWAALGSVDHSPTLSAEYCARGAAPSDATAALKLYATLMRDAAKRSDGWELENASGFPLLAPIAGEMQKLGIESLLAFPLVDREQVVGLLIAEQGDQRRAWTAGEVLLLRSVATQVVVAVNNTRLRRLVRSFSGTDEESGLLPRSSYLDCLLAEAQRAKELSQPLSVCLLEPENPAALLKTLGDVGLQRYFQRVGKALQSNLRQNDVAIRYNPCSIAVVFSDTALPQGGLAVEKMRGVIAQVKLDGGANPTFCCAVCEVPLGAHFDAVDGVTEVINRLETTLERARKEKSKRVLLSKFIP